MAITFNLPEMGIKKTELADFFQKMSMLIDTGYDSCSAVSLLASKGDSKKKDHSADGIRRVAAILLPDLKEGFTLHEAMSGHPNIFGLYTNQVEIGEASGKTADVLLRLSEQIKNSSKIMSKLKSALAYPMFTLIFTFGAAAYLFTSVVPDMIGMLSEVGAGEIPATTQFVMAAGEWFKSNGPLFFTTLGLAILVWVIYGKTIGRYPVSRLNTRLPLIGRVIQNNAMTLYFKNWQQLIYAGAEMSIALKSAAESVPNLYIRRELMAARTDYAENGIAVFEALRPVFCVRELELQTIQVALEGDKLDRTLGILAEDRENEATKSINAMTAAINPIMMVIVGSVVGLLVMSIYEPIIGVSSSLG